MANNSEPIEPADQESPTLDLATTEQLLNELIGRKTFAGIVIHTKEITSKPLGGPQVNVLFRVSEWLQPLQVAQMMAPILAEVLKVSRWPESADQAK